MCASLEMPAFIKKIAIVDDNPEARDMMGECIADADLEPVFEDPGNDSIEDYLSRVMSKSDAAIFDHHLKPGNYATFSGAEAVAHAYENHFPSVLMTLFAATDIKEIRPIRRNIPVLISGIEAEIEIIKSGLKQCLDEFSNLYSPERKPHRTLVRIKEVYKDSLNVVVPAWNHRIALSIPLQQIPKKYHSYIAPEARFTAHVNIGASSYDQIYFEKIEIAKVPDEKYSKLIRS